MQETDKDERGEGLPIAPSMDVAAAAAAAPVTGPVEGHRLVTISAVAIGLGTVGGVLAWLLLGLIALITNAIYLGRLDFSNVVIPAEAVGWTVLFIPLLGALVIGVMARFGSPAIRGHGIPEVMDKVLHGQSRIPPKLMFLKPLSAAIAIGTGGPFGAEGPIIATGGAVGSTIGQILRITADERKTLLAAGAAAGMAATFGTPVSAVLLAIELLLFEYRARSIIPVALAASAGTAVRMVLIESGPVFDMPPIGQQTALALISYVLIGAAAGLAAVAITRTVYAIEDGFERLPIHWMWWPALGALVVGVCGFIDPRILGVGYVQIEAILSGELLGWSLLSLLALKMIAWSIYLGSGTSGGTLAPLFIIGGGLGAALGAGAAALLPNAEVSVPVAALVGMASVFAGASHALLASIVFAFEATRQPLGLLPLLAGGTAAYLMSILLMRTSIMTERLARRGASIRPEYSLDFLSQIVVDDAMSRDVRTVPADRTVAEAREWILSPDAGGHSGFPVVTPAGEIVGVITRRDLFAPDLDSQAAVRTLIRRAPIIAFPTSTLREAADHMVRENVGRLPVLNARTGRLEGIITRSNLLTAHRARLKAEARSVRVLRRRGAA